MKIVHGNIAVIDGDTHISKWVEESGRLDHDQYALPIILQHIKPGDTVIDAGAFIGDHTIAYIKAVGPTGQVYAFEPNQEAFECLKHNCPEALNFNVGVSDKYEFVNYSKSDNAGAGRISRSGMDKIQTVQLDTLEISKLNFLKMDIEGHELKALLGAQQMIAKFKPTMWIEINAGALEQNGTCEGEIYSLILSMGYSIQEFPEVGAQYDILCKPNSR